MENKYDPELLYVECSRCGQPVLWQSGGTTRILEMAGIDLDTLDERCMLISDGCPACSPGQSSFSTQVVRLNGKTEPKENKLGK